MHRNWPRSWFAAYEREWNELLFTSIEQLYDLLHDRSIALPTLSEASTNILFPEGQGRTDRRFVRYTSRVVSEIIQLAGDKVINGYTRNDAPCSETKIKREVSHNTVSRKGDVHPSHLERLQL